MNYCASNSSAEIIFMASEMILTTHSDVTYLVAAKARSTAAGYHFFGNIAFLETKMESYLVN